MNEEWQILKIKAKGIQTMKTKLSSIGITHKILMLFVLVNVIGDIGNIAFWWANPSYRSSLNLSIIGNAAGTENALLAGTVVLSIVAIVYLISLFGLMKKFKRAPLLIIAISIANRAIASFSIPDNLRIRFLGNLDRDTSWYYHLLCIAK